MRREIAIRAGGLICLLGLVAAVAPLSEAASFLWTGNADPDHNWSTGNNWSGMTAPPTNDPTTDITFGGGTNLTPDMDMAYTINSLTFGGGASTFTLDSSANHMLTIGAGGITNSSDMTQIIDLDIVMNAAQVFDAGGAAGSTMAFGFMGAGGSINTNGHLLTVTGSADTLVDVVISGSGGLTKNGNGTLTLGAVNSTGPVTLNAGTITAAVDGALPDDVTYTVNGGTLNLNSFDVNMTSLSGSGGTVSLGSATMTLKQTTTQTYSGTITGTGNLHDAGAGTMILAGNNSYTGTTTIDASATLQVGNGSTTGTLGTGNVTDNGALTFDRSNALPVNNVISGTGAVRQIGTGTTTLGAANSYSGGTTVTAGTLQAGVNGALPNNTAYTVNGGTLDLNDFNLTTSSLKGSGGAIDLGSATLTDSNSATSESYAGVISGTGNLVTNGNATTLTLTGNNNYSGTTTVGANSTLQIGAGGGSGTLGTGNVTDNGTLIINRSGSVAVANVISGTGALTLSGSGTVNLSAANTYMGPTNVNTGTLNLTGSVTSNTTVASGATLTGIGSILGAHNLVNSGNLTPGTAGTPNGTLSVGGTYTNNANSNVNLTVNSAGDVNKLAVTGAATLNGGTVNVNTAAGFQNGFHYNFLTANGGITGDYSPTVVVNGGMNNFIKAMLGRSGNTEFVVLESLFSTIGTTTNQRHVGHYLDQIASGASGDLQTVLGAISMLPTDEAAAAFEQLSGDIHGTLGQIDIQTTNLVIYQVAQRLRSATFSPGGCLAVCDGRAQRPDGAKIALVGCGPDGEPEFADACDDCGPQWSGWVQGFGLGGAAKSDGNAPGVNYASGGTIAGIERWVDDCHLLGFYGGYVGTDVQGTFDRHSSINGGDFGAYLMLDDGFSYYSLLGGFEFDGFATNRALQFDDVNRTATSNYFGWENYYYLERGFSFESCNSVLQPFAALQYIYLRQNSFVESGANSIDLAGGGVPTNSLRSILGARAQYAIYNGKGRRVLPEVHALWLHEFLDSNTIVRATFSPVPTGSSGFTAQGLDLGRDWALVGANFTWEMLGGWSMFVNGDIQTNAQTTFYVGSGGIGCQW
jgi:outer membrane autotransporter protein